MKGSEYLDQLNITFSRKTLRYVITKARIFMRQKHLKYAQKIKQYALKKQVTLFRPTYLHVSFTAGSSITVGSYKSFNVFC
jgi:hypothetical protein